MVPSKEPIENRLRSSGKHSMLWSSCECRLLGPGTGTRYWHSEMARNCPNNQSQFVPSRYFLLDSKFCPILPILFSRQP
jgi:hypothetical protein